MQILGVDALVFLAREQLVTVHMNSEKAEETQVTICQLRGALNPQLDVNICSVSAALCQHLQCVSRSVSTPAVRQLRAGMSPAALCQHLQCIGLELE